MESMPRSDEIRCLFCDGKMPLHRKIASGQFCSTAHRKEYWKEQERLAVERLSQTDQTLRATFAELHATLDEQAITPVINLNVEPPAFPGTSASRKKNIPRKKLSFEQEELARKSSNRGQVVRANFVISNPPDGAAWSEFVPRSGTLDFLIPDFVASSLQAMSLRFQPVAFDGANTFGASRCRVNAAGPVKLSNAVASPDESTAPAASTATPKALEPSIPPVVHDLVFRFAPEEPEVLRASADIVALASAVKAESLAPVAYVAPAASLVLPVSFVPAVPLIPTALFALPFNETLLVDPAPLEHAAVDCGVECVPAEHAAVDEPVLPASAAIAMKKVAPVDSVHAAARIAIVPVETAASEIAPVEFLPVRKTLAPPVGQPAPMFPAMFKALAASASSAFGSPATNLTIAAAWMPPAILPFHDLAPFGQAEPLCIPPMAKLLRLPKLDAAGFSPEPAQRNIAALQQAGSLMFGGHSPRAIAPKLRFANAARYPLSASPSAPLQDAVEPAGPHSFDVAMPELRLHAVPSIESPDWGWLMPLSFAGEAVRGATGPCVPTAALVAAFPEAREPNLPGSRLEAVPDSEFKAPPRSLRMFAHWLPGDASGHNPWTYATDFVSHAPRDLKLALFVIPVLLAMALHPRLPKFHVAAPTAAASTERNHTFQNVLSKQWDTMQQNVAARAAVALTDDFRSGLEDWQMRSDNSAAWSFDSNGFVRPGSLALYRPSMGLTDYQLQFLGLIDKKALSWVVARPGFRELLRGEAGDPEAGPAADRRRHALRGDRRQGRNTRRRGCAHQRHARHALPRRSRHP